MLVVSRRCRYRDIETADRINLIEIDLGKNNLLFNAHTVVALPVERTRTQAAKVSNARYRNVNESVEKLVHTLTPKRYFATDGNSRPKLKGRNADASIADDGLLPRNPSEIGDGMLKNFTICKRFANTHVQRDLGYSRTRHRIRQRKSLHDLRHRLFVEIFL